MKKVLALIAVAAVLLTGCMLSENDGNGERRNEYIPKTTVSEKDEGSDEVTAQAEAQTENQTEAAAVQPAQTASVTEKTDYLVWIPTNGGQKYHSRSDCSGMKSPKQVKESKAQAQGFSRCKRCY